MGSAYQSIIIIKFSVLNQKACAKLIAMETVSQKSPRDSEISLTEFLKLKSILPLVTDEELLEFDEELKKHGGVYDETVSCINAIF